MNMLISSEDNLFIGQAVRHSKLKAKENKLLNKLFLVQLIAYQKSTHLQVPKRSINSSSRRSK